jgi:anti-anti-sigma factor
MTEPPATFEIHESRIDGWLRLSLTGELDLGSASALEDRLAPLRALRSPVSLDLSRLEFIDSTGIHLLIRTIGDARIKRWDVQIERDVSPQVMSLFRLVRIDHFVQSAEPALPPEGRGRPCPTSSEAPPATSPSRTI